MVNHFIILQVGFLNFVKNFLYDHFNQDLLIKIVDFSHCDYFDIDEKQAWSVIIFISHLVNIEDLVYEEN